MLKRFLCLAMILMMVLPVIALADEPVVVTAVLQINPEVVLDDNPVVKYIEENLGIRLIIEAPPLASYGDRVKMLMATGDMPDLVHFGADVDAKMWAEEELLLELTDLIDQYPNMSANHSKEQRGDCDFFGDDRIWGLPRANSYDKWGFLINKKWLDKVGKEIPTTIEEFVDVCRAFAKEDPDGNGVDDTFGVSLGVSGDKSPWHLENDFISMAYSISGWHHGMPDADGSAKLRALKSGYGDYLQLLRLLYEEGLLDPEFIIQGSSGEEKFFQGRTGIYGTPGKGFTNKLEKYGVNPDDFVFCAPLVLEKGKTPQYAVPPSAWMAYYVNAKSKVADAVLRLLDWADSEEGFTIMQMGFPVLHYNTYDIEKRAVDRTDEQFKARQKVTSNMFGFANAYKGLEAVMGGSKPELIEKWQKEFYPAEDKTQDVYFSFTKMLDKIGVEFPDEVATVASLEVRYVTGEASFEELMNYVNGEYKEKTAAIAQEFADFMAEHPARFE